ncbi:MAG: cellulase [Sphingobacteriaceae bacterium]|nr:MAG: cellulase [Sphingobacteriaceae bacterium]
MDKNSILKPGFLVLLAALACNTLSAQNQNNIALNQLGFLPNAPKMAIVSGRTEGSFSVQNVAGKVVFKGELKASEKPDFAGVKTASADFSALHQTSDFVVSVDGLPKSYSFKIKPDVYAHAAKASIKAFYFQRASAALPAKYAGKWFRAEGHPDSVVLIHPSAASLNRPAGTKISAPRGWYDAGDYNKYVVNSGISTGTLLSLYEEFPQYMASVQTNIPETGNGVPDILNEVLWNLRWLLTMQDPADGGVYNKLTNANFDAMEMPDKDKTPRYVVQKGTAATLDFVAVTAQASRIFKTFSRQFPGLADSCLSASKKAWAWAQQNPKLTYDQNAMNKKFEPKISTGGYGDASFTDEFIWAASELTVTTGDDRYYQSVDALKDVAMPLPGWSQVKLLGLYSLAQNQNKLTGKAKSDLPEIKKRLIAFADGLLLNADETAFRTVFGKTAHDFGWGSNSTAANQGIALIKVYQLTQNKKYLNGALGNLDYLLGRNATGFSFLTGFGSKTPMHPHHRPSVGDDITDPIPGLLVGGANPGMQDGVKYPSAIPDRAYIDDDRAYAANEIAINWNAPFAYLINAVMALKEKF